MQVPDDVKRLVETFVTHKDFYRSGEYKEAEVRLEFVDPLFKALGWDVRNEKGLSIVNKEVIVEESLEVEGATKAPDYCFRIGGDRKFFVEAKKPSIPIDRSIYPAFQLRRYGWSAGLPISILTDFEEFAIYDCSAKPIKTDSATKARLDYLTYVDYEKKWEELISTFSRDAIENGSLDEYVPTKQRGGSTTVDKEFLKEIELWRDKLAKNIAIRNPGLTVRELNYAVQVTIDRILFLRICEDRSIEDYEQLQKLVINPNVYSQLCVLFRRADERYNSGLFYFQKERDRTEPRDELTLELNIDDRCVKDIIKRLYYPDSPYEFSVLPADILGQVYEQFLGKVIRLTPSHQAKVEEKPEVRKAGGVYYTPTYIVDYIAENTVGKLLEGKTPKEASNIKILDPACGSGSFLIVAYQYLLDWHREWYANNNPEKLANKRNPCIRQIADNDWNLTTSEKKRILLNNIYGVDIDSQAVEVTKLSLLLKVLEGENEQTVTRQLWTERALPDLSNNIKCGNSLIDSSYYQEKQTVLFDEDVSYKVNAFDWQIEFSTVFEFGGFDAVIGNPPYIQLSMSDYYDKEINSYITNNYSSSMGRLNTFGLFIERGLELLVKKGGYLSLIVPNTLLTQEYYQSLRKQILLFKIESLTTYKYQVFEGAVVETIVFAIINVPPKSNRIRIVSCDNKTLSYVTHEIEQSVYESTYRNSFLVNVNSSLIELKSRVDALGTNLKALTNINQAIALKHDRKKSLFTEKEDSNYKPVLDGLNINRYSLCWGGNYLLYDVTKIHSCKRTDIFEVPEKLFFRRTGDRLIATYDNSQYYALNTLVVITLLPDTHVSIKYLLGLINSKFINFYYLTFLKSTKKVFSEIQAHQMAQIPIRSVDIASSEEEEAHDNMVRLVDKMLSLKELLQEAKTPQERTAIQRQIEATDRQIDKLVYELYGLAEEEISIVENACK